MLLFEILIELVRKKYEVTSKIDGPAYPPPPQEKFLILLLSCQLLGMYIFLFTCMPLAGYAFASTIVFYHAGQGQIPEFWNRVSHCMNNNEGGEAWHGSSLTHQTPPLPPLPVSTLSHLLETSANMKQTSGNMTTT